ncbi:DUF2786 domain-containing protein [Actinacidiphila acidipaludis]|uniref:DUF2786 domain-containing protein n=1 Tax=Actinacidiphila acidipaludis TaxID=2873382 RepID=UPI0027E0C58F|nr:DUF2786 domain-containing protein [Streptomyces acidipaludis]
MDGFEVALGAAVGAGGRERELDTAASLLAAAGDGWDTVAAEAAARIVREAGARGWTVPDLVRMTGRELTARHQRLAEAVLPGEGGLTAFVAAERLDRFSAAAEFVEVLCLCARLPRIPVLAVPARPTGPASKMLGRIRALLAKAESTGFPEEAEALSAKAQQLMAAHSIDEALLGRRGDGPAARRIGVDRPYEGAKALLLDAVAAANRCEAVWASDFGFSTVVGHPANLDAVELLFTSLLVQADRALHRGKSRSRDYRESFLIAYAAGIRERLSAAAAAEVAARPADLLLPALAARDLAVRETRERLFPSTRTARLKGRDAAGWAAGRTTASEARL